ncbi:hypothetical protein Q9L42_013835 [Methylomarinum sp. Ch1-1]|uniref:Uncharacterized protein n=1 Tax=Methylomarinum roseum TaxID=3067653 RepID=A0AAU7NR35_9GAMM|nr:hypothetical protein [Methylomarinum sp. Ch1-1]MDP4520595.1 hypothetical protein [Methylomarinum sp. Ch1-1]
MVETDVHFPTDINLLYDAIRKAIEESHTLAKHHDLPDWRQYRHNIWRLKQQYRRAQQLKRSTSQDENKQAVREQAIQQAHQTYLDLASAYLGKSERTLKQALDRGALADETQPLQSYQAYARLLLDQIERRVIRSETIPHAEKIFSVFEPHTEWISKGKASAAENLGNGAPAK